MSATQEKKARRHQVAIRVYCHDDEREKIIFNAKEAGISLSEFLRKIGQGYAVQSQTDREHMRKLGKVGTELGRIGGLLKALLKNDERFRGLGGQQLKALTTATLTNLKQTQTAIRRYVDTFEMLEVDNDSSQTSHE